MPPNWIIYFERLVVEWNFSDLFVSVVEMEATLCDQRLIGDPIETVQQQLLRRVFQMCDVQRRGHISIDDLLELGQTYLGQDTKVIHLLLHFYLVKMEVCYSLVSPRAMLEQCQL